MSYYIPECSILLHQRGPGCRDEHGAWDTGGGAIEFGETLEDALRRELLEELSTTPLKIEFLGTYDVHRQNDGVQTHWIAIEYAVQVNPKTVKNGEPHKISDMGWFTSKNLPSPLHSQFAKAFAAAQKAGVVK